MTCISSAGCNGLCIRKCKDNTDTRSDFDAAAFGAVDIDMRDCIACTVRIQNDILLFIAFYIDRINCNS